MGYHCVTFDAIRFPAEAKTASVSFGNSLYVLPVPFCGARSKRAYTKTEFKKYTKLFKKDANTAKVSQPFESGVCICYAKLTAEQSKKDYEEFIDR